MSNVISITAVLDRAKALSREQHRARMLELRRVSELRNKIAALHMQMTSFFELSKQDPDPGNRFIANGFYLKFKNEAAKLEKLLA